MKNVIRWALGIAASGLLFVLIFYFWRFGSSGIGDQEAFALFGDFMGGVLNPILGFATILILLRSLWLQNEEMQATRKELEDTRNEMILTRQIHANDLELQARNHLQPRFEKSFYERYSQFDSVWKKPQNFLDLENGASMQTTFAGINLMRHGPRHFNPGFSLRQRENLYSYWEDSSNQAAVFEIRHIFYMLWQTAVSLIGYSDTSIETDEIKYLFAAASSKMKDLDLVTEDYKNNLQRKIDNEINARKEKDFPLFHQAKSL